MDERSISAPKSVCLDGPDQPAAGALAAGAAFGQYRIVRLLGRGGMGEVYEVEHTVLERRYALKLLPTDFATGAGAVERFRREARVMANLDHAGIVRVDEFGETGGLYWLRMELARGARVETADGGEARAVSLAELAAAFGARLPAALAGDILRQVLEAMAFAHAAGAVHRDLKPGNILISGATWARATAEGVPEVKVADFGLVRVVGESWLRSRAEASVRFSMSVGGQASMAPGDEGGASTRSLLGTYEYMSPEQKDGAEADARSDVYALGLLAYRLLTGRTHLSRKAASELVPGLPAWWDGLIDRAVEESPADRFADAGEMVAAVKAAARPAARKAAMPAPPAAPATTQPAAAAPAPPPSARSPSSSGSAEDRLKAELQTRDAPAKNVETHLPSSGQAWTVPELGMKFVYVAPGSFQMGSQDGSSNEKPLHAVRLSRGFWLGTYEVTQAEYEVLTGANPSNFQDEIVTKQGFLGMGKTVAKRSRGRHPVEQVSWNDATAFCAKLTARERAGGRLPAGYEYRLPTEAEWEYAARGGPASKGYTYAGSNNVDEVAWYDSNSGMTTHPVGQKRPTELGLYDMSGNVYEWCLDWYDAEYYGRSPNTDPANTQAATGCVARGGSWGSDARRMRSASRNRGRPDSADSILGFRACLAPQSAGQ